MMGASPKNIENAIAHVLRSVFFCYVRVVFFFFAFFSLNTLKRLLGHTKDALIETTVTKAR